MPTEPKTDGAPTTSTSADDASTTQGRAAALGPTAGPADPVQRVVIEAPEDAPEVHYDGTSRPTREPSQADYEPFTW